ncbi:MAG: ThiF family adenylyltransferase [Bryobacteraceae bacterium]|nr:ThiF family adenylyltransferase [Bryobacteraceae bacterium]
MKLITELDVTVVGAGALGNAVAAELGSRKVRSVLFVDPDRIERQNLALAPFFAEAQLGQPKATALGESASTRFPETRWEAFDGEVADLGWGRILQRQLILGCVDRDSARLEMARISTRLGIPVCDGGLGNGGRASYFPADRSQACFGCRLTALRRRELLSTWRSEGFPCREPVTETGRVATLAQASETGKLMVDLALDGDGRAETYELRDQTVQRFELSVGEGCPFHDAPVPLWPWPEVLEAGKVYAWEWPICAHAACRSCGQDWWPWVRWSSLRRCPGCGGEKIVALECVDRMEASSAWAGQPPGRIGLPEDHRYTVRDMRTKKS